MISVIIPARNERFLQNTIDSLLTAAKGPIEIIVALEGYWPSPRLKNDPRVSIVHHGTPKGMRASINEGVALAKGEYIMKIDAHCMVGEGFDEILKADCEDNWVVIPRRKRLDAENWTVQDVGKPDVDYEYLSFPDNPTDFGGPGLNGRIWTDRILERKDVMIDDNLSFQGSCWFMKKSYFHYLELMDDDNYGPFWNEAQEIGFKAWLSGGRVVTNKNTWYAHLHKGKKYGRGYTMNNSWAEKGATYTKQWINKKMWDKQIYDFDWLIEKFMPMPTWPENWKQKLHEIN